MNCEGCKGCEGKDKEISLLKGRIDFHIGEGKSWRKLFEEQRGGEAFEIQQRELIELRIENIQLRNRLKGL